MTGIPGTADEVTYDQAAAARHIRNGRFTGNTLITSFNEMRFFGIVEIQTSGFDGCTALQSIIIPSTCTSIATRAFADTALESLVIPDSVTSYGENMLNGCHQLRQLTLSQNANTIPSSFARGCDALQKLTIPDSVTSASAYAFRGCAALKQVIVGAGLSAFKSWMFENCTSLETLILKANSVVTLGTNSLNGVPSSCVVRVPAALVADYQADSGWSRFTIQSF